MSTLLDAAFARALEALRRRLDVRARSGDAGARESKRRGGTAEFAEHRAYAPGDDARRIDFRAWARSGEPVVKVFRTDEDVLVRLVVDGSASMREGEPPKLLVAQRLAAAMGYLALASSERAQAYEAGDGVRRRGRSGRGRAGVAGLLADLERIEATGPTSLARAIDAVARPAERPGQLVVVSDFLDEGAVTAALGRARAAGHDVALVQVLARDEVDPPFDDDVALEDAETGEVVEVTVDADARAAYLARLRAHQELLAATARKLGGTYVRVVTDELLEPVIAKLLRRAIE